MKYVIKNKIIGNILYKGKKRSAEKILLKTLKELIKTSIKQYIKVLKLFVVFCLFIFKRYEIKNKKQNNKKTKDILNIIKTKNIWIFSTIKFMNKSIKNKALNGIICNLHWQIFLNALNKRTVFEKNPLIQKQVSLKKNYYYYYYWW